MIVPMILLLWVGSGLAGVACGVFLGEWAMSAEDRDLRRTVETELSRRFYRLYRRDPVFAHEFRAMAADLHLVPVKTVGNCVLFARPGKMMLTIAATLLLPPMGGFWWGQSLVDAGGPLLRACIRPLGAFEREVLDDLGNTYLHDPGWRD